MIYFNKYDILKFTKGEIFMPKVTSANACKILTKSIIESLNDDNDEKLTLKDINWEQTVTPMLKNESKDSQNKMNSLKDALSSDDRILKKLNNIRNAIEENLKCSQSWIRRDFLTSTFFGLGTPKIWRNCLNAVNNKINEVLDHKVQEVDTLQNDLEESQKVIKQMKSELSKVQQKTVTHIEKEIDQTLQEVKKVTKAALQNGAEARLENLKKQQEKVEEKVEEIQTQTESQKPLRSSSAPILSGSPLLPPPPPPPPPPPINSVPTVKNPEIKNIQKLIQDFKKDVDENKLIENDSESQKLIKEGKEESEVIKIVREKRIKEIKEEAKKASKKYFGEGSPISKSVLEKPDVKKIIYKASKSNKGQTKEFLWPALISNPNNYDTLVKNLKEWRSSVNELKVNNRTLYEKVKAYGFEVMSENNKNKYSKLRDEISTNRLKFVKMLLTMQRQGFNVYKGLKKYAGKNKSINTAPKKTWYEGKDNLKWVKTYIEETDLSKKKDYFERLEKFIESENNKFINPDILSELKDSYEKVYNSYEQLKSNPNKTPKEQKNLKRFETNKSNLDAKFEDLKKCIEKSKEERKQLQLIKEKKDMDKINLALIQTKKSLSLGDLLQQILVNTKSLVPNAENILKEVMDGTYKYEKIKTINDNEFKL